MKRFSSALGAFFFSLAIGCGGDVTPDPDGGGDVPDAQTMDAPTGDPCETAADCDDGLYCDGAESCMPGASGADARGCLDAEDPCAAGTTCDEGMNSCVSDCPDFDGDGFASDACGGTDCDDMDERRLPGGVEVCDAEGVDEDCDTRTLGNDGDEDGFVSDRCCNELPTGRLVCGDDCDDTMPTVSPVQLDACGNGDQDCDGAVDENPDTIFFRDLDGDGYGLPDDTSLGCSAPPGYAVLAGDCDDTRSAVNPGNPEACNLRDDNCDGSTDEGCGCSPDGLSEMCGSTDVGSCRLGSRTCVAGTWSSCSGVIEPVPEVCDGIEDDDCNGTVDDGCDCTDGSTRVCGVSLGVCRSVMQVCTAGHWPRACADEPGVISPSPEECDGALDQNCDGAVDEGCLCVNGAVDRSACGTDVGECETGMRVCSMGTWGACSGGIAPAAEVCEGSHDENCDGGIDEGCSCTNGATRACGVGACAGTQTCASGMWGACSGAAPSTEICNGIDDDCDGLNDQLDTGVSMVGASCGTDEGLCTAGTYSCPSTSLVCSGVAAVAETCDHQDQDCDALLDDGVSAATCTQTFQTSDSGYLGSSHFICHASVCGTSRDYVPLTRGGTSLGNTAELVPTSSGTRATVDWGMDMRITESFQVAWTDGAFASGTFGVLVSPSWDPNTSTVSSNRFPVMTGSQRAWAATYNVLTRRAELWELTGTGPTRVAQASSSLGTACLMDDLTTTRDYQITFSAVSGTLTATVSLPWCAGTSTATFVDSDFTANYYVESASYPRYAVGAYAWAEGTMTVNMTYIQVRRTATSNRSHCIACPW